MNVNGQQQMQDEALASGIKAAATADDQKTQASIQNGTSDLNGKVGAGMVGAHAQSQNMMLAAANNAANLD